MIRRWNAAEGIASKFRVEKRILSICKACKVAWLCVLTTLLIDKITYRPWWMNQWLRSTCEIMTGEHRSIGRETCRNTNMSIYKFHIRWWGIQHGLRRKMPDTYLLSLGKGCSFDLRNSGYENRSSKEAELYREQWLTSGSVMVKFRVGSSGGSSSLHLICHSLGFVP